MFVLVIDGVKVFVLVNVGVTDVEVFEGVIEFVGVYVFVIEGVRVGVLVTVGVGGVLVEVLVGVLLGVSVTDIVGVLFGLSVIVGVVELVGVGLGGGNPSVHNIYE